MGVTSAGHMSTATSFPYENGWSVIRIPNKQMLDFTGLCRGLPAWSEKPMCSHITFVFTEVSLLY